MDIAALQEAEPWTGASIVAGIVLLLVVVAVLTVVIRNFLRG